MLHFNNEAVGLAKNYLVMWLSTSNRRRFISAFSTSASLDFSRVLNLDKGTSNGKIEEIFFYLHRERVDAKWVFGVVINYQIYFCSRSRDVSQNEHCQKQKKSCYNFSREKNRKLNCAQNISTDCFDLYLHLTRPF